MSKILELEALGTKWWVKFFNDSDFSQDIKKKIVFEINDFESLYSRFRSNSLISRLNQTKFLENPPIDLYTMIKKSQAVFSLTQGGFNISVGAKLEEMGYGLKNSKSKIPNPTLKVMSSKALPGGQKPKFVNSKIINKKTKILIPSNTRIDLGGIGKGYLIEKLAGLVKSNGIKYFLINGGGDIYVTSDNNKPVKIMLENPFTASESIGWIELKNSALSCSGINKRTWQKGKKTFHHLIDMKNNRLVKKYFAVFAYSKSILNADLCSTAIFVSNEKLKNQIAAKLESEYLIIYPDSTFYKSKGFSANLFS